MARVYRSADLSKYFAVLAIMAALQCIVPVPRAIAQDTTGSPDAKSPEPMYTLHVYEDLVQVTALVLDHFRRVDSALRQDEFLLHLDAGPGFRPRHIRLEGDDPITLAILIDESWAGSDEVTELIGRNLERMPHGAFTADDHVSVYAFDCNLLVAGRELPATSPALPKLFPHLLREPALHRPANASSRCDHPVGLWDALAVVGLQQAKAPGRRVLVVLSPGPGAESRNRPDAVRHMLAGESVSVFAGVPALENTGRESPLVSLCQGTGGMATSMNRQTMSSWLVNTLETVRRRYVLEFPRPAHQTSGLHEITVTTPRRSEYVFVSGVSVPLRDPKRDEDPYTVPNAPEPAPVFGSRKILTPQ